jgi:gliding motility-associated-like protein
MLKLLPIFLIVIVTNQTFGQGIRDSLIWVTTNTTVVDTSPDYFLCDTNYFFQISTTNTGGFTNAQNSNDTSISNGVLFPALPSANLSNQIPIKIEFNFPVKNVKLGILGLDEDKQNGSSNPEEFLNNFNLNPTSVISQIGNHSFFSGNIEPIGNNVSLEVYWQGPNINTLEFIYNKPGANYALGLSFLEFECTIDSGVAVGPPPIDTSAIPTCTDKTISAPNIFTPNGDHVNDLFEPILDSCLRFESLSIYNRWGNLVYSSSSQNSNAWDGKNQEGQELSEGVYLYSLRARDPENMAIIKSGFIHLIR